MELNLNNALNNVDITYDQLISIADDMVKSYTSDISEMINNALSNVENLTNDMIRDLVIKLSLKAFTFGDIKEKSLCKAECAEALRKEAYAVQFNSCEGSVAAKDNTATINISNEIMTEKLYNLVSSLFKTKLDELHRCVDTLKTVLTSRLQEARLSNINIGSIGE